jgi:hypothetical protein
MTTTDSAARKKRADKLRNDQGYSFEDVVKIMVNTPPPPAKKDAKDRARKKRTDKSSGELANGNKDAD